MEKVLKKVAELARLKLTEGELKQFTKEVGDILKVFSEIDKVDTRDIEPAFQPIKIESKLRQDEIKNSLAQKEALANAQHKEGGYFKGPKAI